MPDSILQIKKLDLSTQARFLFHHAFTHSQQAGWLQLQNEKNLNTGASGFIVSALRNSVVDYFTEDKTSLIQILEDKISEFICPKLSKLSSAITDKTDDLKTKIVA